VSSRTDLIPAGEISPLGLFEPPELVVECEAYTGTLSTLFLLVKQHKVDLLGVPLAPICEAYLLYLIQRAGDDLEAAATALAALAYLLERKSFLLLPAPEIDDEPEVWEDPPEPYVHEFAEVIHQLSRRWDERDEVFFRPQSGAAQYELPFEIREVSSSQLAFVLERLLKRAKPDLIQPLGRPRRSLSEQMELVMDSMTEDWRTLDQVVVGEFTRSEAVWWFLALLELIRLSKVCVKIEEDEIFFAAGGTV